jgi:hypothetical protein
MKKGINLIPLNNDLNKLSAFIPSLDSSWRANQRIKSKPVMVESLDAVREFQKQGWNIAGAYEQRGKNRKVNSHFIRMEHPDFKVTNSKGKVDAVATMNISNTCNGSKPMELDLGAYRQVCSNGMIAHTSYSSEKVPHSEQGQQSLQDILCDLGIRTQGVMEEFNKLKKEKGWLCHPSFSYFAILFTNQKDEPLQPKKIYNPDANGVLSLPEFMGTNSRNQRDFNCARKNN